MGVGNKGGALSLVGVVMAVGKGLAMGFVGTKIDGLEDPWDQGLGDGESQLRWSWCASSLWAS